MKNLRTFEPEPPDSNPPKKLKATWQCVSEFFYVQPGGVEVEDSSGNVFQRVEGDLSRFVCLESRKQRYAKRDLIGDVDGVLEIPISFSEWLAGTEITLKLRDYMVAKAEGAFPAEMYVESVEVNLRGTPEDPSWIMSSGATDANFEDELTFKTNPGSWADYHLTIWAVRRPEVCTSSAKTISTARPGASETRGIVIHYNSGFECKEKRGTKRVPKYFRCRDVYDEALRYVQQDNKHCMEIELALHLLKNFFTSGKTGYHYHIARDGLIMAVAAEDRRVVHSGSSREPEKVKARTEASAGPPQVRTQANSSPTNKLDNTHIGINLMGYHSESRFYYTPHQLWYLDRLIENIQSRRPTIQWHTILGHDEVRAAFKAKYPARTELDKDDPGAALAGGMEQLRGRHGAFD